MTFTTRDGLTLHGDLELPPGASRGAVVLCHPHPLNGGSMQAGLIPILHRALVGAGFTALRFDFRGVGRSEGSFGHGTGEVTDLAAAVAHLRTAVPDGPLVLVGWSFGAAVALRHLVDHGGADGWLGIALALGLEEHGIPGVRAEEIKGLTVPLRFVHGTADDIAPLYRVRALTALTEPAALEAIDGGDHFLRDHVDEVTDLTVAFVAEVCAP